MRYAHFRTIFRFGSGATEQSVRHPIWIGVKIDTDRKSYIVNQDGLPKDYPTHKHEAVFWEKLGRTVVTFGFLEEVLSKAIFSYTATTQYTDDEIKLQYEKWLPKLEKPLSDPLGGLIDTYGKSVRNNQDSTLENIDELISDLREASKIRNVICHGSWRAPDQNGASTPFFVNKHNEIFETPIDVAFLDQTREHVVCSVCAVVNTVTHMGWQFPGSSGPGEVIWNNRLSSNA